MVPFQRLLTLFSLLLTSVCFAQSIPLNSRLEPLRQYRPENNSEIQVAGNNNGRAAAVLPPANDNCSGAITLTVNGACYTDSTNGASTQTGENTLPCGTSTFTETVWYRFTATATNMWVQLNSLRFSGSGATWGPTAWTCAVYKSNTCLPASAPISCQNSNSVGSGDGIIENILTGLSVGSTYYIQVGYRTGMGINLVPTYCIRVGDQFTPVCNACSTPCGPACGFTSTPTVPQVTSTCPPYNQYPYLEGAVADTQCYTFYAVNTTVSFNVIVNSTCGSGNVTGFSWWLYNAGCGTAIQTGTLSNLTFTGLTIGAQYRYCYTFTTPSNCYHTAYYPYFVGASPLPVDLLEFSGETCDDAVCLKWSTASEVNNDHFLIERSVDGLEYVLIGTVDGQGTKSIRTDYTFTDNEAIGSTIYYRLTQVDFDGTKKMYTPIAIKQENKILRFIISPNPTKEFAQVMIMNPSAETNATMEIFDLSGNAFGKSLLHLEKGVNTFSLPMDQLQNGIYSVRLISENGVALQRFEVIR